MRRKRKKKKGKGTKRSETERKQMREGGMLGGGKVKGREGYVGDGKKKEKKKKKKKGRCTWMVEKKGKEKKKKRGISYGCIEGERNKMGMDNILGVVKKIK